MTEHIDRDALRKLADAATPGPWEDDGREVTQHWSRPEPWRTVVGTEVACGSYCLGGAAEGIGRAEDAAFIAAARTAIPALLDALDRQERITTALRAEARVMRGRISDLAQEARDERGAALDALAHLKLRDARIKAVEDVLDLDAPDPTIATRVRSDTIRRALEG